MIKFNKLLTVLLVAALAVGCVAVFGCGSDAKKESVVLTQETDFEALVSEKVTAEQWESAFDRKNYNNCTIVVSDIAKITDGKVRKAAASGNDIKVNLYEIENGEQIKDGNGEPIVSFCETVGGVRYYYLRELDSFENLRGWHKVYEEYNPDDHFVGVDDFDNFYISYKMFCPDFGKLFSSFEYNDESGCYVLKEKVTANSVFEYWDIEYAVATVKIINGKLAYVTAKDAEDESNPLEQIYFYDFGTTKVTIPEHNI